MPLDLNTLSIDGHPISKDATYAERRAYREDVLKLPGPVDRWLTANSRCPRIGFLQNYLLLEEVQTEYVTCVVEREYVEVSATPFHHISFKLRCELYLTNLFLSAGNPLTTPHSACISCLPCDPICSEESSCSIGTLCRPQQSDSCTGMDTLEGNLSAISTAKNIFCHLVRTYCRLEGEQAHRKATFSNFCFPG